MKKGFPFTSTVLVLLSLSASEARAQSLHISSDADGISSVQSLNVDAAKSDFDPDLTLNTQSSCGWQVTVSNSLNGAVFQVRRSELSGPTSLQSAISISAEDGGGQTSFVPSANYQTGVKLPSVSTSYETLGWIQSNGKTRFRIKVSVYSKSKNGNGSVSGSLSIIGALL